MTAVDSVDYVLHNTKVSVKLHLKISVPDQFAVTWFTAKKNDFQQELETVNTTPYRIVAPGSLKEFILFTFKPSKIQPAQLIVF